MTPEAALEAQIERYRQMTREQRREIGFRLNELARKQATEGIRSELPGATEEQVEEIMKERMLKSNGLELKRT